MEKTVLEDCRVRCKELRETLTKYQEAYYIQGRPLVSDLEYDRLFDELSELETRFPQLKTEDSPTQRVGSDLSSDFPEVEHSIPVLSLDKAYNNADILSFIDKSIKNNDTNLNLSFALEEKIDGFSIVLYYEKGLLKKAVTRGNGHIGNDVTANAKTIRAIPLRLSKDIDIAVRGEIYLPKKEFQRINSTLIEPYANPRNLAAGTIRRNKSSETAKVPLSIFVYEGFWMQENPFTDHIQILQELKELGFPVDNHFSFFCKTREEAALRLEQAGLSGKALCFDDIKEDIIERTEKRPSLDYEIDGLVIKINELAQREAVGYTDHHPRWAIAYKFEAPQAQSIVETIDVQVGRTGRITPMARIQKTVLSGSTISNITLHNQDYVNSLELAIGDTVAISKRGDVIPAVEKVTEKNTLGNTTWKMPDRCPVCNSSIEKRGAHHFCTNIDCPDQVKGRIEFFCAKKQMDIEGLGPETIRVLFEKNLVKSVSDLFTFNCDLLYEEEGFGAKKIQMIRDSIAKAKNTPFRKVLQSIGIPEFGKKAIECLVKSGFTDMNSFLSLKESDIEKLSSIDQIGPITARLIIDGFNNPSTRKLIEELKNAGLKMEEDTSEPSENQIFAGQSWCITGTFNYFQPRDKAMEEIVKRGGNEVSSVSKKTTCLLAGENAGSKLKKAIALGVKIVNEQEFLKLISVSGKQEIEEQPSLF